MDLPAELRPSRLSPHFVKGYIVGIGGAAAVAVGVAFLGESFTFLPFPPWYLYALALLPLVLVVRAEIRRHHHDYEFRADRVMVRNGVHTVEQEDVPYAKITDVSSVTPPWESLVDVGDLEIHIAGTDKAVPIIGVKHPQQWEDLMLGRLDTGRETQQRQQEAETAETVREQLRDLERAYDDGRIGRAEYERRYYYLQGKRDALEER